MIETPDIGTVKEQGGGTEQRRNCRLRSGNESFRRGRQATMVLRLTQTCRLGIDDMSENGRPFRWQSIPGMGGSFRRNPQQSQRTPLGFIDWAGIRDQAASVCCGVIGFAVGEQSLNTP